MQVNYIVLGGILLVFLLLTMTMSCGVTPYRNASPFINEYTYEGMEDELEGMENEEGMEDGEAEGMEDETEGMEDGETEGFTMSADESKAFKEYREAEEKFAKSKSAWDAILKSAKTSDAKEGFTGLEGSDYTTEAYSLDKYSSAAGDPTCLGKSSGLSNSMGPLCLSDEQKRLLQTRGGNATSGEAKI